MQMRLGASLPILTKHTIGSISGFILLAVVSAQNVFALPGSSAMLSDKNRLVLKTAQQKMAAKDYQQALKLSDSILTEMPAQFEAQFIRAQALSQLGRVNAAIELYQSILESKPSQPAVYNNLATLYAGQGKLDLARQTLDKGMATSAQYKTLHDNLSAIYVEMARGAYSKALNLGVQAKTAELKTLDVALQSVTADQNPVAASATLLASASEKATPVSIEDAVQNKTQGEIQEKVNTSGRDSANKPSDNLTASAKQAAEIKNEPAKKQLDVNANKDEVINALQGWAAAWSAQAVDLYLSFYGKDFKPVKLSKKVWVVQRRIRIRKPRWVNVRLNDFDVKWQQKDKMVVQLVQDYRADNYRDKTKKQFIMQRTADGWRILSEKSVAVIR